MMMMGSEVIYFDLKMLRAVVAILLLATLCRPTRAETSLPASIRIGENSQLKILT